VREIIQERTLRRISATLEDYQFFVLTLKEYFYFFKLTIFAPIVKEFVDDTLVSALFLIPIKYSNNYADLIKIDLAGGVKQSAIFGENCASHFV
jgi:hypothetical protein